MEEYGFARTGIPGEYSPFVVTNRLLVDVSNTVGYTTIVTATINIETPGELLTLLGSITAQEDFTGGTPVTQFTVDGVAYGGGAQTLPVGGATGTIKRVRVIENLLPGPHTVTLDWRNGSSSFIKPASLPTKQHAVLVCQRNRVISNEERGGFPQKGWPMIYTCGTVYQELAVSKTSTSATVVDSLVSFQFRSNYSQSCLLLRFTASGEGGTTQLNNLFQVYVDDVVIGGTSTSTGTTGFTGVRMSAAIVCIAPVQAGIHNLEIKWAGGDGTNGTVIDPATDGSHAILSVEEVFCDDLNIRSDMEGFVATGFASRYLPRVGYSSLKTDVTNGGVAVSLLEKLFYVSGDNSGLFIEVTSSNKANTAEFFVYIVVDGVTLNGGSVAGSNTFNEYVAVEAALNTTQGNHFVQVFVGPLLVVDPVSHPEYSHLNMVIREIAQLQ